MEEQRGQDRRWSSGRLFLALFIAFAMIAAACGSDSADDAADETTAPADDTETEEAEEPADEDDAMDDEDAMEDDEAMEDDDAAVDASDAAFISVQMGAAEERPKLEAIVADGGSAGLNLSFGDEGPVLDQILAGSGSIDVFGGLHGAFPPLARENAMTNVSDLLEDLSADRTFAPSMVSAGLLGTDDNLAYIPWAQATYIMAADKQALDYLPEGADINALTWPQLGEWCAAIQEGEGRQLCGLPRAGLFHRFLEGYMWPSFTGGMVSEFRSAEAEEMMTWLRDDLSPTLNPESLNYEFMQEPLLSGEVWVAFDHVARLIDAFSEQPDTFIGFPTPAGPAGRGFMPVILGLGIPADAPNPEAAAAAIEYLTRPEVQAQVLGDLAFFPVVEGVDTSSLPEGVQIEADAVEALLNSPDGIPALLPVGLGERGGEINQIFRNVYDRVVDGGEDIATVLNEEGDSLQALLDETGAPCWAPDPASDGPCVVAPAG